MGEIGLKHKITTLQFLRIVVKKNEQKLNID